MISKKQYESLTRGEARIFDLIGQGLDKHAIAEKQSRSVKTIEVHRENIKKALKIPSVKLLEYLATQYAIANTYKTKWVRTKKPTPSMPKDCSTSHIPFGLLRRVHALARKAQVNWSLHFCDGANEWYFRISSMAPSENHLTRDYGNFECAVSSVVDFLLTIQPPTSI